MRKIVRKNKKWGLKMSFSKKLKSLRIQKGLSQQDLAKASGVSSRTIQYYESDKRHPSRLDKVSLIAKSLGTTSTELLGEEGLNIIDSAEKKHEEEEKKEIKSILDDVAGLFAGGDLCDEDKDEIMRLIQESYWDSKKANKKYGPKRK